MIQTAVCDPSPPAIGGGKWSLDQIGKGFDPAKLGYDCFGEPFHLPNVAIIATSSQATCRVNGDRIVEPDGDNGYMDIETLRRLMADNDESQADIGRLLGLSRDKMSRMLKGKRRMQVGEADTLRRYFGLDTAAEEAIQRLPIIGLVSAGTWKEAVEQPIGWMPKPDPSLSKDAFAVIVEGDSMDLVAQEGEVIIIEPRQKELLAGKFYVIMNEEGETTFKRYMENPARFDPCSSNESHQPMLIGRDQFTVVGRARKRVQDL